MGRWGFELDDDELANETPTATPSDPDDAELAGQDDAGIITVVVTDAAEVRRVRLADGWRHRIDPRGLDAYVADAANAATAKAAVAQLGTRGSEPTLAATVSTGHGALTRHDLVRLIDAATADIARMARQAGTASGGAVTVRSRGGHIAVTGADQQVRHVDIDPSWAAGARDTEVAEELTDALAVFGAEVSPDAASRSSALDELTALISDPERTLRRLGLPVDGETAGAA